MGEISNSPKNYDVYNLNNKNTLFPNNTNRMNPSARIQNENNRTK